MHLLRPTADIIQLLTPEPLCYFSNICVCVCTRMRVCECVCVRVMICTYVDTLMHEFKVPEAPLSHSQMLQLGDTPLVDKKINWSDVAL